MSLENLIRQLEQGICPAELSYTGEREDVIDWDKVRYNTFFKSHEFFENKLPEVLKSLPAYDKIIDLIVEKNKDNSPLKEMEEKQNISKED
jgi:hypothetical protein